MEHDYVFPSKSPDVRIVITRSMLSTFNETYPKAIALINVLFHFSPFILPEPSIDKCILKGFII